MEIKGAPAKTVRSRHVTQYFPSGNDDDIVLNRVSGLLFDQKSSAVLRASNPLGSLATATPGRAGLRIAILRRDRRARARCNGATSTEKLISRDSVLGDLFTHCRDDAFEFRKASFFSLLGECLCLRFKFEISRHIWRRIPLLESGAGSKMHSIDASLPLVKSPRR